MRYYSLPTESGVQLVVRNGGQAYSVTSTREEIESFTDLARAAATSNTDIDEIAVHRSEEAAMIDPNTLTTNARLPVSVNEVWAAGITYEISEQAREAESGQPDVYLNVYENDRLELFLKATASRTVGPGESVGVRGDSNWNVPEPELGIVLYHGEIVGYTIGNDVSSRTIEGENPLYLPQAKIYDRCCAIGPCVASATSVDDPHDIEMAMTIDRNGETVFEDATSTSEMVRTCEELVSYLTRHNTVSEISILLTGTSLVPPDEFTLREGDTVSIKIDEIGTLENPVVTV